MVFEVVELDEIILGMQREEHLSTKPGRCSVRPGVLPESAQQGHLGNWRKRTMAQAPLQINQSRNSGGGAQEPAFLSNTPQIILMPSQG